MGFDSIWHWIILLVLVLLIFGTKKIRNLGPDLGAAIRDFKKSVSGEDDAKQKEEEARKAAEQLRADPPRAESTTEQSQRDSSETK
jgi:sec-independent protein translocase protein TatA